MLFRPTRALRRSIPNRGWAGVAVLAVLLSACGGTVSGSAALPSAAVAASGASSAPGTSALGQITVPSGGPGGPGGSSVASNSSSATTSAAGPSAPVTAGTTAIGPVPAGLAKFYLQKLSWGGCRDFATSADDERAYASTQLQCARLTVPLSYDKPTGQTITVGLLRKQATDSAQRIGSVLVNPGGPGGSGMSFLSQLALPQTKADGSAGDPPVTAELNKTFDLVGFDPRGVGSSLPAVKCQTDAERDAQRLFVPRSRNQADVAAANAESKKIADLCAARVGAEQGIDGKAFLANVGTANVAKDLDVMRAALGDAKLTYVGFSYGTQIGWTYAEQFPTNVRALLLDGMVSPDQDPATDALGQATGFQNAFDDFATWCSTQAGCVLGPDPSRATAVFQSLVRPLLDQPLALPGGRQLSYTDAITGTFQALYSDSLRTFLASGLTALSRGDGRGLMALADFYDERDQQGHYQSASDAFNAVRCVDHPRTTVPAEVTKLNADYNQDAPFQDTGDPAGAIADICALWPVPATGAPHKLKAPGLPKVLIISTTGDPATPYQNGVEVSKQINSTLLTVKGTRHGAYLTAELSCVNDIGNAYLEKLTQPPAGASCS